VESKVFWRLSRHGDDITELLYYHAAEVTDSKLEIPDLKPLKPVNLAKYLLFYLDYQTIYCSRNWNSAIYIHIFRNEKKNSFQK